MKAHSTLAAELFALQEKVEALEVRAVVYDAFTAAGPFRFQTSNYGDSNRIDVGS